MNRLQDNKPNFPSFTLKANNNEEFNLKGPLSKIEIVGIEILYLLPTKNWFEQLRNDKLKLVVNLSYSQNNMTGKESFDIQDLLPNLNYRQPIIDGLKHDIPSLYLRESGSVFSNEFGHYDKMKLTLESVSNHPIKVKFYYKSKIDYSSIVLRCFNCGSRSYFSDAEIEWRQTETQNRTMGVETMYAGDFEDKCTKCLTSLGVEFFYWTYPEGVLNYHEENAENCLVVKKPNFMRRHHE